MTSSSPRAPTSKQQGWQASTFDVTPETLAQLRRVVWLRKLQGSTEDSTEDLSDTVEAALQAWLNRVTDLHRGD